MSSQSILAFWKEHPKYWISGPLQEKADAHITSLYFPQDVNALLREGKWLDAVIYLDQFMRHFSRVPSTGVCELDVVAARSRACELVKAHTDDLAALCEEELMFATMALKHAGEYEHIFAALHAWLPADKSFHDFHVLNRFYKDSYMKMLGATSGDGEPFEIKVPCSSTSNIDWSPSICEACPPHRLWGTTPAGGTLPEAAEPLIAALRAFACDGRLWVSLSGGVDSNLMCALARRAGLDVCAVHIVYGNRTEAEQEVAFLTEYCAALGVTLYVYRIPWIRRATAERAFYESVTRKLRFAAYRGAGAGSICLGHIQEDVVENVWTNFAHGAHLENLTKMRDVESEGGVAVLRPWLSVRKADVYAVATALHVPYLQNTTPAWSNRGKFRSLFHPATHAQYGTDVDTKVLEVAETLRVQSEMLDRLLYKPVFDSWDGAAVDTTPIFAAGGIDAHGWLRVLTYFCHNKLGVSKPSIHSCRDLSLRLGRPFETLRIALKRGLTLRFTRSDGKVRLTFISSA